MPRTNADRRVWFVVWTIALVVRLLAVFLLPNAEQDAYSYVETISLWHEKIRAGDFHLVDLFGFWLPLFQFASAVVDLALHNALLSGKLVSALTAAVSCVLVFALTNRLTKNLKLALLAFAFVLFCPLHLLYSAASMTDVPFGCLTLAMLWFALNDRWTAAAICASLAALVRLEAWTFVIALPLLQLVLRRRISWMTMSILLVAPAIWLIVSHAAAGNWLGYFAKRAAYQNNFIDFHRTRQGFLFADVFQDLDYFFLGANAIVMLSIFIMLIVRRSRELTAIALATAALLAFLALAYVTKSQPVILPRYGLVFFVIGLPVFASFLKMLPRSAAAIVIAIALHSFVRQFPNIPKVIADSRGQEKIATALAQRIGESRCFTDDVAVRVLAHLPRDRFLRSETTPTFASENANAFEIYLREQRADFLVFIRTEDSLPVKFFPQLGHDAKIDIDHFEFVAMQRSPFGPDVWLYRLRNL